MEPDQYRRIEELFHAALEHAPRERAEFLARACGDDASLRDRVEALLGQHERGASFLERPVLPGGLEPPQSLMEGAGLGSRSSEEGSFDPLQPGDRIGPFLIRQRIGEGGFGVVYEAEQTEPIRRRVAVKVLKLGMDTREVIHRFEAERQALAMMDHPYIATVFDAGKTDAGRPYFVMEYVSGVSITEFCDRQQLRTKPRLELFLRVCRAIQHAHTRRG